MLDNSSWKIWKKSCYFHITIHSLQIPLHANLLPFLIKCPHSTYLTWYAQVLFLGEFVLICNLRNKCVRVLLEHNKYVKKLNQKQPINGLYSIITEHLIRHSIYYLISFITGIFISKANQNAICPPYPSTFILFFICCSYHHPSIWARKNPYVFLYIFSLLHT